MRKRTAAGNRREIERGRGCGVTLGRKGRAITSSGMRVRSLFTAAVTVTCLLLRFCLKIFPEVLMMMVKIIMEGYGGEVVLVGGVSKSWWS